MVQAGHRRSGAVGAVQPKGRHHAPGSVVRVQLAPGDFRREGDAAREGDVAGAPRRDAGPTVADEQRAVGGVERATRARIADVGRLRRRARKRVGDGERGRAGRGGRAQGGRRRARVAPRQKIVRGVNERERETARMRRRAFSVFRRGTEPRGAEEFNDDAFFQTVDVRRTNRRLPFVRR